MLNGIKVRQIDSNKDHVTLQFRCTGDTETNYDGFLSDATNAIMLLYENYGRGVVRTTEARGRLQQKVANAIDRIFQDLR